MTTICPHVDLHCHSTVSDGTLSPEELVSSMSEAGVKILALTDHDSTDGITKAREIANLNGIRLITGVEISATWGRQTVHIVGLAVDPSNTELRDGLAGIQAIRRQRAEKIAIKLEKLGLNNALIRAEKLANGGQITRPHFAKLLIEDEMAKNSKRAFKQYLGAGKPAYVSADWPAMEKTIEWIHASGGLAVIAHPMHYGLTGNKRRQMLNAFVAGGGDAMEVTCGPNSIADNQVSARDAERLELMGSVGSDFHDPAQSWIKLGKQGPLPTGITPVWEHAAFS